MKAAFVIQRRNYYKYMGPLIREAMARGWACEVWLDTREGGKEYLAPTAENIPDALRGLVTLRSFADTPSLQILADHAPDVIISLHTPIYHGLSLAATTRFITLQHGLDTFWESTPEQLASSDALCLYGPYWLDWACTYYAAEGHGSAAEIRRMLEPRAAITGSPQMDVARDLDRAAIRRELGIPAGKKVVLLLPINLTYWPGEWPWFFAAAGRLNQFRQLMRATRKEGLGFLLKYWRWPLQDWNDAALIRALRQFCDRNDALLIVKTRRKDPLRPAAEQAADLALVDENYYPSTILRLLAASDLCVHFYSSAVLEAAISNVFGVCVHRPNLGTNAHKLWRTHQKGGAFNFPGVNQWFTIPQFIRQFAEQAWDQFALKLEAREAFIRRFLTTDQAVSANILDHIETLTQQQHIALAATDHP